MQLLIFNIALILFLKDSLNLGFHLKRKLGYSITEEVKPFDCYFCLIMWTSIITSIITLNLFIIPLGYLIAITIDGIKRL
jgi:hypothetical protein